MAGTIDRSTLSFVLLVHPDDERVRELTAYLQHDGFNVVGCYDPDSGLNYLAEVRFAIAVVDSRAIEALPEFSEHLRAISTNTELIVIRDEAIDELRLRILSVARRQALACVEKLKHSDLESSMLQAQKMESLGLFAGGIAHDFNNLLTAMQGHAMLAMDAATGPVREHIASIEGVTLNAADLCRQLLAYAGKVRFHFEQVDLNEVVTEMSDLLSAAVGEGATLALELDGHLPQIDADATQLSQVVMNLITNASDAFAGGEGTITVRTCDTTVDAERAGEPAHGWFGDDVRGSCIMLEVRDDGIGMDALTVTRIFDPFFTTKSSGHGLGLADVLGIVHGHHAAIHVKSAPGEGTTFRVLFPTVADSVRQVAPEKPVESKDTVDTILVMEDEEILCDVVTRLLRSDGYQVIEAHTEPDGLELLRQRNGEISAVLIDLSLAGSRGSETVEAIRKLRIDVPVVVSGGWNGPEVTSGLSETGNIEFLHKPFEPHVLLSTMRSVTRASGERWGSSR